jgi:hypothetical protein
LALSFASKLGQKSDGKYTIFPLQVLNLIF